MSQFRPSFTPDLELSRALRAGQTTTPDDDRRGAAADPRQISVLFHRPRCPRNEETSDEYH